MRKMHWRNWRLKNALKYVSLNSMASNVSDGKKNKQTLFDKFVSRNFFLQMIKINAILNEIRTNSISSCETINVFFFLILFIFFFTFEIKSLSQCLSSNDFWYRKIIIEMRMNDSRMPSEKKGKFIENTNRKIDGSVMLCFIDSFSKGNLPAILFCRRNRLIKMDISCDASLLQ